MKRYRSYGALDEAPGVEGDVFWRGVNERMDPAELPPGWASGAKNYRFRDGKPKPRLGLPVLPCGKTDGGTPWTNPVDAVRFYDITDDLDWIVVVAESKVWRTRPHNVAQEVSLPAGETVANYEQMFQAKGVLVMLRGDTEAPLYCRDLDEGFLAVPNPPGTALPIPNSRFGLFISNRTVLVKDLYTMAVSLIGDYIGYEAVTSTFQINEGDFDTLVAIASYQEGTLIGLKDNSIWGVQGFYGNLSQAVGPIRITDQYGLVAPFSVIRYGRNLAWWSGQGVATLQLTEQNEIQCREVLLTDDMPKTMGRVNQAYQRKIRSAEHNGFLYFAVPLDDAKIYGAELLNSTSFYDTGSPVTDPVTGISLKYKQVTVTAGARYRWEQGNSEIDVYLENDTEKFYGSMEFTATNNYVRIYGKSGEQFSADVGMQEVTAEGVLSGVMVYDLNNEAWCGTDEGDGLQVVAFFKCEVLGQEQLCYLGQDGFIHIYGMDIEDEVLRPVATPYAEILINAAVAVGQTCQVNGGTLVTAVNTASTAGGNWNVSSPTSQDIYRFSATGPSYANVPSFEWTAPNTTKVPVGVDGDIGTPGTGGGCRFVSTNGVLPVVKINGVTITSTGFYGTNEWAYVELHSGQELTRIPIETRLLTRGYRCQDADGKRYAGIKAHVATWAPKFSLSVVMDGVNESKAVFTDRELNRLEYEKAGAANWDDSNEAGDFLTPYRKDYSVVLPAAGMVFDPAGVPLEEHQHYELSRRIEGKGQYLQLDFTNTQGRLEIRQISAEARAGDRTFGIKM